LLHAIISVESAYAAQATSSRGALGLMQVLPQTARSYGVTDAFDPQQNITAGARHLRVLLDQFNGNLTLALAAYNAGAAAVLRYGARVPPFAETQAYVPRVLARLATFRTDTSLRSRFGP
jgi:soluble lytic murein transglycosylase-like protein